MSQVRKRAELELRVGAFQRKIIPACQVCGAEKPLVLHHILRRSLYARREIIDFQPTIFHALICDNCNMNNGPYVVDNPEGRAKLLAQNTAIFGDLTGLMVEFSKWSAIANNGHNDEIVSFDRVREIYNREYEKTKNKE